MGQCLTPFKKDGMDFPCGKCYECYSRRMFQWSFRLQKEAEVSSSAFFLTLTYEQPPITENGEETLCKRDIQLFLKRLRKLNREKLVYFACGEYGGKTDRPHYHMILFNAQQETIERAWKSENNKENKKEIQKMGSIHFGTITEAAIHYTLKYMCKDYGKDKEHTRQKEFALMSKGIGKNYLTPQMKKWHKAHIKGEKIENQPWANRMYCNLKDGKKIAMPRYYKEKIYTKFERQLIGKQQINRVYQQNVNKTFEQMAKEMEKETLIRINKTNKQHKRLNDKI